MHSQCLQEERTSWIKAIEMAPQNPYHFELAANVGKY